MGDRITTRLGDGFDPIAVGEADVAVIAGIGGMNIAGIIERGYAKAKLLKRLILQPQHDTIKLRKELHRLGFFISDERLAREGDRYYIILVATPMAHPALWKEQEYYLGKFLSSEPDWKDYIAMEIERLEKFIHAGASGEKRNEYVQRLQWLKEAL
jgi:tRNA (adenine22-N1)-methyltransferase